MAKATKVGMKVGGRERCCNAPIALRIPSSWVPTRHPSHHWKRLELRSPHGPGIYEGGTLFCRGAALPTTRRGGPVWCRRELV
eukprot:6928090-Pyramimonas_sp.AAC.1